MFRAPLIKVELASSSVGTVIIAFGGIGSTLSPPSEGQLPILTPYGVVPGGFEDFVTMANFAIRVTTIKGVLLEGFSKTKGPLREGVGMPQGFTETVPFGQNAFSMVPVFGRLCHFLSEIVFEATFTTAKELFCYGEDTVRVVLFGSLSSYKADCYCLEDEGGDYSTQHQKEEHGKEPVRKVPRGVPGTFRNGSVAFRELEHCSRNTRGGYTGIIQGFRALSRVVPLGYLPARFLPGQESYSLFSAIQEHQRERGVVWAAGDFSLPIIRSLWHSGLYLSVSNFIDYCNFRLFLVVSCLM